MDDELQKKVIGLIKDPKDYTDEQIAKKLKISRSSVWRVRDRLRTNPLINKNLLSDDELKLYNEYKEQQKTVYKRPWWTKIFTLRRTLADGPINQFDEPGLMDATAHHEKFLNNYSPSYAVEPIDVQMKDKEIISQAPFVAKTKRSGQVIFPKFFMNPYQALDYIVLQDIYMHTVCGTIIDVLVAFTMGKGIRPVLKLNDEDNVELKKIKEPVSKQVGPGDEGKGEPGEKEKPESKKGQVEQPAQPAKPEEPEMREREETKDEAITRIIDENKSLLEPLIEIDKSFSDPLGKDPYLDESFNSKIEALVRNHWIYGRCLMTYEYFDDRIFEWDNKKFPDIPNVIKIIHPRDIGFVKIDQPTLKLVGTSLMFSTDIIEASDMLYLEHQTNSAIYNGKFYGYSKMHRMIGHGRALRKLIDRDFPNVASIGYAGFSIIAFKEDSKGTKAEIDQNTTFVNTMTVGSPNATTLKDPEHDMKVHDVDTDPKISEMIEMAHYHAEAAAKTVEVPTTLISKEKDPNRDTLMGVLRVFNENVIRRTRTTVGRPITDQYYMKNFRIVYKGKDDILEKFRVEAEFDDYKLESWDDLVAAVVELSKLFPLKAAAVGEFLGIPNFESKIDPEGQKMDDMMEFSNDKGDKLSIGTKKTKQETPQK